MSDHSASTPRSAPEREQGRFPKAIVPTGHVEPAPRRVRGVLDGLTVFDTSDAWYVWEWPYYPQYYVPVADIAEGVLGDDGLTRHTRFGTSRLHTVTGVVTRHGAAAQVFDAAQGPVAGTVRFDWAALDAWFEEDEQIFVHPRNPYVRVDAVRSNRSVRVEVAGTVLAEAVSSVRVFETGLPTRHYVSPTDVDWALLEPTGTVTACPYKGVTSRWWSARLGDTTVDDLAWSYDFPTRELGPIAGLVAFYDERVDLFLDGALQPRPTSHLVT